jgi:phosphoglycolate phosphatase-like HAD superfamily hydrolase
MADSARTSLARIAAACAALLLLAARALAQPDPLPSWNDGDAKSAILAFVESVTSEGSPDFVPVAERIATFDNDGTLITEQPMYFQIQFAQDRIRAMLPAHPAWNTTEPFATLIHGDRAALAALGDKGFTEIMAAAHVGMTSDAFEALVLDWLATARHPRFDRPYTELVYQPMLELMAHLRANGFKTFVVTGSDIAFMRPWAEAAYGVPPEQVVGSSAVTAYRLDGDAPVIDRSGDIEFVDDGAGKPVGIHRFIGRRPVFAAGNSDGDLQMLQWTTLQDRPAFAMIVHHTDAAREWAYDRDSPVGHLAKALDEAPDRGWLVVDMKTDWARVYPFEE